MITNFWKDFKIFCMNGHKEPVEMVVMEGSTPFFACPRYMLKDEAHPDGHEEGEPGCLNRISLTAVSNLMEKLMKIVEKDDAFGAVADYTGMQFQYNGIQAKVLKYSNKDVHLGIVNRRALQS